MRRKALAVWLGNALVSTWCCPVCIVSNGGVLTWALAAILFGFSIYSALMVLRIGGENGRSTMKRPGLEWGGFLRVHIAKSGEPSGVRVRMPFGGAFPKVGEEINVMPNGVPCHARVTRVRSEYEGVIVDAEEIVGSSAQDDERSVEGTP